MSKKISILIAAGSASVIGGMSIYLNGSQHRAGTGTSHATVAPARSQFVSVKDDRISGSVPGGLPPVIVPPTVTAHGSFTSARGATFHVFAGTLRRGALGTSSAPESASLQCVTAVGPHFSGVGCGHDPLRESNIFFFEASEGGPTTATQTENYVVGLTSPRVARVEAVDSGGGVEQAQVNSLGAFFVELPPTALENGVRFVTLRVYDAGGKLIEQADA
jgi:hypothetical protein